MREASRAETPPLVIYTDGSYYEGQGRSKGIGGWAVDLANPRDPDSDFMQSGYELHAADSGHMEVAAVVKALEELRSMDADGERYSGVRLFTDQQELAQLVHDYVRSSVANREKIRAKLFGDETNRAITRDRDSLRAMLDLLDGHIARHPNAASTFIASHVKGHEDNPHNNLAHDDAQSAAKAGLREAGVSRTHTQRYQAQNDEGGRTSRFGAGHADRPRNRPARDDEDQPHEGGSSRFSTSWGGGGGRGRR